MQDRYVGDIGDFAKYALLKALVASDLRLGVVWYLNPDEEENEDGKFTRYPNLRECDESSYDKMQILLAPGCRNVACVERAEILPPNTIFYAQPLSFRDYAPSDYAGRIQHRDRWLQHALAATREADVVFFDPDNGFAPQSASATGKDAQKYVFPEEIAPFLHRQQSLVIYHHHAHNEGLDPQLDRHHQELAVDARTHNTWAITFHRRSVRAFFVVEAGRHSPKLLDRSHRFLKTLWGQREHFKLWTPTNEIPQPNSNEHSGVPTCPEIRNRPYTGGPDTCEMRDGEQWKIVGIAEALKIRAQCGRWPGGRCVECHEAVRPHRFGATEQRAHFEHLKRNTGCSRSDNRRLASLA
jgi:hypothetical protein